MRLLKAGLALLGTTAYLAAPPLPLRVLRATPADTASRAAEIAITFDRPVAGSLDRTVDAHSIVSVEPAVPGQLEWRDPVTIVLTPRALLTPATRYRVTVGTGFQAMDGSRLAEPYSFDFRVRAPVLVGGSPTSAKMVGRYLTPASAFSLVYDAPVDLAQLSSRAYLALDATCEGGARTIKLAARTQRKIDSKDPWHFHDFRGPADSLRRVVSLVPASPLPLACGGHIVAPTELAADRPALTRWPFNTYGKLRLVNAMCTETGKYCPTGSLVARFSTPVSGAEVMRHVRIVPATAFTVGDTAEESDHFVLDARLKPNAAYAVVADSAMRDIFGQSLTGNPAAGFRTTGYEPSINYVYGRVTVERGGFGTLAIAHVNVDTLVVIAAPVPDSLEGAFIRRSEWNLGDLWTKVRAGARETRIPIKVGADKPAVTGIKLPVSSTGKPTLWAVRVVRAVPDTATEREPTIAVVQVTDLGVHAKIGAESGVVWVTGASNGKARAGATVTLYDYSGHVAATATTNEQGIAMLSGFHGKPKQVRDTTVSDESEEGAGESDEGQGYQLFEGYVAATLQNDRALVGVSAYDPDLDLWRFNISPASGTDRVPAAGALFTERGIYRPGDLLYAKAIVRTGSLGALAVPARTDSMRWQFTTRDGGTMLDSVVALSAFGTADVSMRIPVNAAIGTYSLQIRTKRGAQWLPVGTTSYRVAEYRAPEFLVDLTSSDAPRFPGDSMRAILQARYLFGAPMGRAHVTWQAWQSPAYVDDDIPGAEGFFIGDNGWWWEDEEASAPANNVQLFANGADTLDASGSRVLAVQLPAPKKGRAVRVSIAANVQDVNRQTSGARTSVIVHPASFYIGAKALGASFFWTAGKPQAIGIIAVKPAGGRVSGVRVHGVIERREWHQVHRERDGVAETIGEWVTDTVAHCEVVTGDAPAPCSVTPPAGGTYTVTLRAADEKKRDATTTFYRWATGKEWVPWNDESRLKVDVIPDRTKYVVGDTATVLFASPFTGAEAWITVEREGLIEQRRMTLTSGSTTLRFPITEAYAPNAFISIFIARGRSAPPGHLDDPGRPTIRVGYAELRVTPEVKRLAVDVTPARAELRPGDSASISVRVRDAKGMGQRSEVTLWAVDEGVLALTGYKTPDPIDQLYRARGVGMRLASNLASVAPQIPEGNKGFSPGGGGGADRSDILRSQFKTTAFFLASVITDADGRATASAKLPDNITTFKVMAVAVTAGDRYGKGESSLLVTRPLLVRAALPRFVRPGDAFTAGAVVNQRAGGTPTVRVDALGTGIELRGDKSRSATLEAGRGREVRFSFHATPADSATFRFGVSSGSDVDAVQTRVPVRAEYLPHYLTIAGVLRDSGVAEMTLPAGIDAARSRVAFSLGASPDAVLRGLANELRVYPYECTEQVTSAALPLLALLNAKADSGSSRARMQRDVLRAVAVISGRQRSDGGIGLWHARDWTSPWLSEYAGRFLIAAKGAGVAVDDSVIARLGEYLRKELNAGASSAQYTPIASWYTDPHTRLSDRVAAVDFLSRIGKPDVAAEHQLVALAAQLWWEDRLRLAEVLARRKAMTEATALIAPAWAQVHLEGNRAELPPSAVHQFYFSSSVRPLARLLTATLAVNPTHPLIGPIVQSLLDQSNASVPLWNTQDLGATAIALASFAQRQQSAAARGIRVRSAGRVLVETGAHATDSSVSLAGLLTTLPTGEQKLRLSLDMPKGDGLAYYYITVTQVPRTAPVRPEDSGVQVERWYESYDKPTPIVSAAEGALVRVRLRVTIKSERHFLVLDDPLPAGLEAVDLSLRTAAALPGPGVAIEPGGSGDEPDDSDSESDSPYRWGYGMWDSGWWSAWDHKELRDDRVVYVATYLWPGVYTASYIARATTPGVFMRPPAHAEEMYNPAVSGRSDGGMFTVTPLAAKGSR